MDLGIALPTSGPYASVEAIARIAREAERLGYAALWTYERLLYPLNGDAAKLLPDFYSSTYEPLETLAYIAGLTKHIKLGTSVINAPFHTPVVLARRLATLDQLSGGRVIAGLGQGWQEQEFITTNVPLAQRGWRTEELIAAMRAAWGPDPVNFKGDFYHIPLAKINPKPKQQGGIPILLGATSPAAIKRAARIADGLNPIAFSFEALKEAVTSFRSAAQEADRDPTTLKIMVRANVLITACPLPDAQRPFLGGSPEQIAADLARIEPLAIDHVLFADNGPSSSVEEALEWLEELQAAARRAVQIDTL
ncbi:TIGR03619 family F420-dependent LLM class oxidoreductase [Ktedonosporobacter rubrisoli]|uniref:TIGR03619 family F420-dependent LLM class oxidoreductase n=1 Tax=Ktedonosporobacter rubrisoli TaxID=2509675 RepID=A0A4P6JKL3_KTERU|nr:TIGR03619 family F420-dependent LLM class oxidoreductase [Ktedonosporobacter rubrisoli]QBD75695.1 TIGR03619 family F420-dependent LLM class oxidoreductase [Ktedonosporobacter rubrisoli]